MTTNTEIEIIERSFRSSPTLLTPEVARFILAQRFSDADRDRMDELAQRAQAGNLSEAEEEEIDEYRRAADLMALLHSKARAAIKNSGVAA